MVQPVATHREIERAEIRLVEGPAARVGLAETVVDGPAVVEGSNVAARFLAGREPPAHELPVVHEPPENDGPSVGEEFGERQIRGTDTGPLTNLTGDLDHVI